MDNVMCVLPSTLLVSNFSNDTEWYFAAMSRQHYMTVHLACSACHHHDD